MIREPLLLKLSQVPRSERVHAFIALASLRAVRGNQPRSWLQLLPTSISTIVRTRSRNGAATINRNTFKSGTRNHLKLLFQTAA